MQLACVIHVLDGDPVVYVLTVKVQREVKRQTAIAYSSTTMRDSAPMYFTCSLSTTYLYVGPQHIFIGLVAATRIQHKMDNIK
jgi:hypothetical protein